MLLGMDVFIWKARASLRALRGVQARAPSRAPPSVLLGWAYLHGGNTSNGITHLEGAFLGVRYAAVP